nr:hypothetical protein [Lachnospiraceae bacterium]
MDQNTEQQDFQTYLDTSSSAQYAQRPQQPNIFMIMSLIMGILTFMSCAFIFFAMVTGGLSILFAILSKGNHPKMSYPARAGITASVAGIILSVILTSAVFYLVFNSSEYRELLNTTYESMYGESFDEALEEIYPSLQGGGTVDTTN